MPGPGEVGANNPVYVQTMWGKIEVTEENKSNLQKQGLLDKNFKPINQPTEDNFTRSNYVELTPEDAQAQAQAAENNKNKVDEKSNNKYAAEVATKLYQDPNKNKDAIAQLTQMTAAANRGDYKEAAAKYEMLQQSGALNGIEKKPPYLDQIKSELAKKNEQKDDVERARNSVNSNDGVNKMIEYYKAHDTKEKLHEAYDDKLKKLGGSELHGARKMARANKKNLKSLEKQQALEDEGVVVGDKKAYKKARKEAENKDSVSYMSEGGMNVAQKINDALLKQGKPTILKEEKDGTTTIDVDAAQEYARQRVSTAGDRADKNEIAELAKEFGVSKKDVKAFFKGINVDYQKNYTIPGIAAGVVAGTATLLNPLAGATVGAVAGATNVYTDVTTTNTIEKSSILNGDQVEESIKNKSETTTNVRKEEVPGSSGHRRLGFGDFLGAAATGVAVEELVRKVVNHDSQILKKNKTIENVLSDKPEKVVRKKSNQDKVRLIQGYDLSAKGYDKETADQIKLALLSDAMGKGGKLNSRELNGVLAQLEAVPRKPKAQTPPPEEQTPTTPPEFDYTKDGTNYKLGNGFWNDKLKNTDGTLGGYVKNPDGSLVQEISGEKANEIGAFGRDNRLDERHKKDSYQVKVPEIGVEHDNWANENKRGKALWGYLHGLLYGNTVANIDESAMRDNALQALANPQSVVVTDPTYGNVWTLTRRDDGNYELTDLKDKDGASLKINKKHVYSLNSLHKKDKDTSNNVAAGFEYQFTNISGSDNGDGRSASDKLTAQIQDDYKKNHKVKKGKTK